MNADELSNMDMLTELACEEIRRLKTDLFNERKLKAEILQRYDALVLELQDLRSKLAIAEGEVARHRRFEAVRYADHTKAEDEFAQALSDAADSSFVGLGK